jgi:hypothetical protein
MEIEQFDKILSDIEVYFLHKVQRKISRREIFDALLLLLYDKENLEWEGDLWDISTTYEELVTLLDNFDFDTLQQAIIIEEGIIPKIFAFQKLVKVKQKGEVWKIHRYDSDPFPSNPHAHNLQSNIKLDLSNGKCYKKREYVFSISEKTLLAIREKALLVYKGDLPPLKIA